MPSAQNIVIADETPTNRTFRPISANGTKAILVSDQNATAAGMPKIELGFDMAQARRATDRIPVKFVYPFEGTDTAGNTIVTATPLMEATFVVPVALSPAQRGHFAVLCANLVTHAIVKGMIKSRDPMY